MAKQAKPAASPFDALVNVRRPSGTAGGSTIQSSTHLNVQTSDHLAVQKAPLAKSADPDFLKFTTYIRKQTHHAVKVKIVEQGREFSDLVEELLTDWLHKQSAPAS